MSIFGSIMSKVFGHREAAAAQPDGASGRGRAPCRAKPQPVRPARRNRPGAAAPQQQPVDVAAVLTEMASKQPQKLDWRHSIVDLMKLLGLDSGLQDRKELAQELGYTGDTGRLRDDEHVAAQAGDAEVR